jgi:hypothetical protein
MQEDLKWKRQENLKVKEKQIMSYKESKLTLIFNLWLKQKEKSCNQENTIFLLTK